MLVRQRTPQFMAGCASMGAVLTLAGAALAPATQASAGEGSEFLELWGIARDFKERTASGGHPDFERRPDNGFGLYCGNVAPVIGDDRKPVFTGNGFKVTSQWKDSGGRPIMHLLYDADQGDQAGNSGASDTASIQDAASFSQWFRDVPGTNISKALKLRLRKLEDGSYVFDDKLDPEYSQLGGFFPFEDEGFGNPGGSPDRNFHFTFELHTHFTYDADANHVFRFVGDDDVFVYIDDKLVIDLGGVHAAEEQYVELDRLGLVDGEVYTLDFFFAERHRTQSNFRIQTNIPLVSEPPITVSAAFD